MFNGESHLTFILISSDLSASMLLVFGRTLDLGFEKDLTVILNALNAGGSARQTVLLSATLTEGKSASGHLVPAQGTNRTSGT